MRQEMAHTSLWRAHRYATMRTQTWQSLQVSAAALAVAFHVRALANVVGVLCALGVPSKEVRAARRLRR